MADKTNADKSKDGIPGGGTEQDRERDAARAKPLGKPPVDWGKRLILIIVGVVVAVLAWLAAAAFFPRWWAHRIGRLVDGSGATGVITGLVLGVAFTFLPLVALRFAVRKDRAAKTRLILVVLAIALAVPNLLTLWIVFGRSKAAHAGERTLDVQAPDFRWSSFVGAIIGALLFAAVMYVLSSRRRRGHELGTLRAELRKRDAQAKQTS